MHHPLEDGNFFLLDITSQMQKVTLTMHLFGALSLFITLNFSVNVWPLPPPTHLDHQGVENLEERERERELDMHGEKWKRLTSCLHPLSFDF